MQNNKKLNLNIQGMRGICALIVFGGHTTGAFNLPWLQNPHNPLRIILDGHAAVIFFFLLSGYFYYTDSCISIRKYAKLIIKRIVHLIPPYWISIMLGALLCNHFLAYNISVGDNASDWIRNFWQEPVSIGKFLNEAKIVMRNAPSYTFINPPSWYLSSDFKAMAIIPLVIWLLNKIKWIFAPVLVWVIIMFGSSSLFLVIFLMGAILHKYQNYLFGIYVKRKYFLWGVAVVGVILWQSQTLIYYPDNHVQKEIFMMEMLETLGAFLLLSIICYLQHIPVMSSRFFIFMGKISYEFYIIHFIFLMGFLPFVNSIWLYIPVCFVASLMVAIILNNCGRWLTQRIFKYLL